MHLRQWMKARYDALILPFFKGCAGFLTFAYQKTSFFLMFIALKINQALHPVYSGIVIFLKKCQAFISLLLLVIRSYLSPIFSPIFTFLLKHIRAIKIGNKTMGMYYDEQIRKIKQYQWVKELTQATKKQTRIPTLVSTFFANILALAFPLSLMQVYDRIIPNRGYSTLVFLTIGIVIAFAVEATIRIIRASINLWVDTQYEFTLAKTAFSKLINAPLHISEETDVGTRLKQFAILDQMKGFYNTQLLTALYDTPFLLIFIFAIAFLGGWLFLVPFLTVIVMGYVAWRFLLHWRNFLENKMTFEAKESDFIINVLTGIHTIKSIGMEELMIRRYEKLQETGVKLNFLSSQHEGGLFTLQTISSQLAVILTVTFGAIMVMRGDLPIGGLAACSLLASRIVRPFDRILTAFNRLIMLESVRKKLDPVFYLPAEENIETGESRVSEGRVTLKNIVYAFPDKADHPVLKNVNMTAGPHELIGIIDGTQLEKSCLLNILSTVSKPTSGVYLLDNLDIHEYQTYTLRQQIAFLNRSGKLFRGTIMDNLSAFDDTLIPSARRLVDRLGLNTILSKLPGGYDTYVGEKAVEALPGGVVNMVLIIRALVNKPKIVLFDETNINLDTQSKQKMLELLNYLKTISTVFVWVSQEGTRAMMDRVFTFQNSELVQVENGK